MRLAVSENKYIEYKYILEPGSYMVNFNLQLAGMKDIVTRDPASLDLNWEINIPQHEQLKKNEQQYTSLYFRHYKEDVEFSGPAQGKMFNNRIFRPSGMGCFQESVFLIGYHCR